MSIAIGPVRTRNRVFLAPMSGVTDEPFRFAAAESHAGLVVTEMVASRELIRARKDMVRRAARPKATGPFVIQLAGNEARWMREGAKVATDLGADVIDINMGCPAREVAGKLSGSALMRDLDHAETLIAATVEGSSVPVTLKMRLGWDERSLNAPELARRAQGAGVAMVTVHGRTRCQFYKGRADWPAIRRVREAVTIPLIANGDIATIADVRCVLEHSGADGVMIGRGAYGAPWMPGVLAEALDPGSGRALPDMDEQLAIAAAHVESMLSFYGTALGLRIARKHMRWYLDRRGRFADETRAGALRTMLTTDDPGQAMALFRMLFASTGEERLAA
ncbi:MAG: tRNA dihydrouridine synthase DusB [Hyphomicrobiales bacterium]